MTGDLAFSGNVRDENEYYQVGEYLVRLADSLGLATDKIFTVPGNYDVQRDVALKDNNVGRLLEGLRSGKDNIDQALKNDSDKELLSKRFHN
ncbi:hypothetical protein [Candidatus Entotheonella palauensis]|uniref:hypothetical protein n=1 Tax=Candidatus Entotheonella palauensis TaxID=93172 RepID=UPI0015C47A70|nr:hypothetical protein [Candidatus Entotheonella palauensis]